MYKSILTEYGIPWVINRSLYSAKLKMMKAIPYAENLFERNVAVERVDLFQIDVNRIEIFLNELSKKDKNEIILAADQSMKGMIKAFSSIELNYGNPINWHINPITNVEVDRNLKWYQIPDFDNDRGDIKAVWEASRFTHFFYLTRAYMLTKDTKYYEAFSNQLDDWVIQNPYSYGANYKCGQEATLRMVNVLISYSVFKAYGFDSEKDKNNLKTLVKGSYKKVVSNFFYAKKCIKNNHTLSEITGLIIGAWCCNDQSALNKAYRLMDKEIGNQFMNDGGYVQYSFNYQRFALQIIEFIIKISKYTGVKLSEQSDALIEKSALMLYQLQDSTGDVPNYGSNDGALIFPLTTCDFRDFRPTINTIYALLKGKRLYTHGNYDEELLWFSDNNLKETNYINIKRQSVGFYESGFFSLRHNNGHLMVVLQDFKSRPAQMDQLHIDLWHNGINVFCDSGTYSYASEIGKQMTLTAAHNTIKIDEIEQMHKYGPFLIYDWTRAKGIEFNDNCFKGTMISKNGYSHMRVINKNLDGYTIDDQIFGDFESYKVLFHTSCEIERKEYGIDLINNKKIIAKILSDNEIQIFESNKSLYYLNKEKINQISLKSNSMNNTKVKIILA